MSPDRSPESPPPRSLEETLDQMPRGARVRVVGIATSSAPDEVPSVAGGDRPELAPSSSDQAAAIARRLDDLGIREGVELEVIRHAPLGDPTVFELHGYQLCLRRSESSRVRVEPSNGSGGRP